MFKTVSDGLAGLSMHLQCGTHRTIIFLQKIPPRILNFAINLDIYNKTPEWCSHRDESQTLLKRKMGPVWYVEGQTMTSIVSGMPVTVCLRTEVEEIFSKLFIEGGLEATVLLKI